MSTENTPEQSNEHNLTLYTDTLDSVPESLHSFYEKEEDGYKLKIKNVVLACRALRLHTRIVQMNPNIRTDFADFRSDRMSRLLGLLEILPGWIFQTV